MSGLQINFNAAPLIDDLHKLANPALVNRAARAIGVYMLGEVQKHFDEQTLWDDSAMPQSAAAAARGGQTLIDKHHLYDSYHQDVSGATVNLGSDLIYAAIQHAGGDAGRNHASHIDGRPVLGVNPRNEREIIEEITDIIMGAVA